jgi:prefoldin beta subunit
MAKEKQSEGKQEVPKIDEQTQQKIQEIQILEQNMQGLLMQKQAFQLELNETENALSEISATKEDVFKLIGQIMIKTDKKKLEQELTKKKELLTLRLNSIEKQEKEFSEHLEELRKEIMKSIK